MAEPAKNVVSVREELDRRLFHLKTLYDMSRELFGMLEVKAVLRKFLFITTGNFGVLEGFLLLAETPSEEITDFVSLGFAEEEELLLVEAGKKMLHRIGAQGVVVEPVGVEEYGPVFRRISMVMPLTVDDRCRGLVGLGEKLTGEPYSAEDRDLLITLGNNLVIALRNARYAAELKDAYEEVSSLNRAKDKVINHLSHELKTPLSLLKAALTLLDRKLGDYPRERWERTLLRAQKNVDRLFYIPV